MGVELGAFVADAGLSAAFDGVAMGVGLGLHAPMTNVSKTINAKRFIILYVSMIVNIIVLLFVAYHYKWQSYRK
jgi:hypothetical protein